MNTSVSKRVGLTVASILSVTLILSLVFLLSQEEHQRKAKTKENVQEISSMMIRSIKFSMGEGISDVKPLIENLKDQPNISDVRIIPVDKIEANSEASMDQEEKSVLASKKPVSLTEQFKDSDVLRSVEPILASEKCGSCHESSPGDPMAVVSIRYSLNNMKADIASQRITATILVVMVILIAYFFVMFFLKKQIITDLISSAESIKRLSTGDITEEIKVKRSDELGKLACSVKTLQQNFKDQAEAADKLAHGDLTAEIKTLSDDDLLGNAMSVLKKNLSALTGDIHKLAEAAIEGRLDFRVDAYKHDGEYRVIVEGMNKTLDAVIMPIQEGTSTLAKLAEGDLSVRIKSEYQGDHQLIKNSINAVGESLSRAVNDVNDAVTAAAGAGNQISSSTEEMAIVAEQQSTRTNEVATAVEEMTRTILDTAKNINLAADSAKESGLTAKNGGEVVTSTVEGMNRIAVVVSKAAGIIKALGQSSDQIGEIIQVINEIADQTNLLALNAAIEAARAGEQGRGFAVVADEVRKLAERTTKATKEIADMIKEIQKDTGEAVKSMDEGTQEVEKGKELAVRAGESLDKIIFTSEKVVDAVSSVVAASEEQSATAEEISSNIMSISSSTSQSATGIQEIAKSAEEFSGLFSRLQKSVNKFKTSADTDFKDSHSAENEQTDREEKLIYN